MPFLPLYYTVDDVDVFAADWERYILHYPAISIQQLVFFGGDVVQKTISLASVGLEIARNPWCSRQKPWILFWTTWSCPVQV